MRFWGWIDGNWIHIGGWRGGWRCWYLTLYTHTVYRFACRKVIHIITSFTLSCLHWLMWNGDPVDRLWQNSDLVGNNTCHSSTRLVHGWSGVKALVKATAYLGLMALQGRPAKSTERDIIPSTEMGPARGVYDFVDRRRPSLVKARPRGLFRSCTWLYTCCRSRGWVVEVSIMSLSNDQSDVGL